MIGQCLIAVFQLPASQDIECILSLIKLVGCTYILQPVSAAEELPIMGPFPVPANEVAMFPETGAAVLIQGILSAEGHQLEIITREKSRVDSLQSGLTFMFYRKVYPVRTFQQQDVFGTVFHQHETASFQWRGAEAMDPGEVAYRLADGIG